MLCWNKMFCSKTNHRIHFFKSIQICGFWKWNKNLLDKEIQLSFLLFSCTMCAFPNPRVFFCCLCPVLCFEVPFCWTFEEPRGARRISRRRVPHTRTPCNNVLLQFSHSKAQLCFPRVGELVQRKRLLCWAVGIKQRIAPKPAHMYFPSTGKLLLDLDRLFFHIPQTCPEWLSSFMLVWQLEEIILFFFITLRISFKWAHRHS